MTRRKLKDSAVVITGASSGIGRATALELARQGATVVLAARREQALREAAAECEAAGGRALAVPTDVSDEAAVRALARQAIEQLGRIDVWVNNAAVTLFARFEDAPSDVYRQVIETNLFGYIHGARAVLPFFREQGSGVLINVDSVVASAPQPYTSAYVASKFAVRGFTESLRMELSLEKGHDIHVCSVAPATMDTPLFQHAANYTGRAPRAMPPVYRPEQVARAIVKLVRKPEREVLVGKAARALIAQHAVTPGIYERTAARLVDRQHLEDAPAPPTPGNVLQPVAEHTGVHGGWHGRSDTRRLAPALVGAAVAASALALWARGRDGA